MLWCQVPGLAARAKGHWFCGFVSTVQGLVLQLRAQACHEFHPCEPQRLCASSALVFSQYCGSVAGGWHLFPALCPLAAVSLPLQAEPHMLQQPKLWQELLVWACFLLFWSLSQCLCCRTRFGWPGLCRGVMAVQWEERGWKEPGFPSQVSGLLLPGVCATGSGCAARLGVGGLGASGSAPVRGPQGPYLRGSWPQPGVWALSPKLCCPGIVLALLLPAEWEPVAPRAEGP